MAEQQLIGALEAGGTKMVCATGYADGTVLEREQIATTTPQETVEAVNAWFADKGIAALGIGAFGPTAVNPASPQYGKILETPKTAWRYFDLLGTIQNELDIPCGYDTDVNVAAWARSPLVAPRPHGRGVSDHRHRRGRRRAFGRPARARHDAPPRPATSWSRATRATPLASTAPAPSTTTASRAHRRSRRQKALGWQERRRDGR